MLAQFIISTLEHKNSNLPQPHSPTKTLAYQMSTPDLLLLKWSKRYGRPLSAWLATRSELFQYRKPHNYVDCGISLLTLFLLCDFLFLQRPWYYFGQSPVKIYCNFNAKWNLPIPLISCFGCEESTLFCCFIVLFGQYFLYSSTFFYYFCDSLLVNFKLAKQVCINFFTWKNNVSTDVWSK